MTEPAAEVIARQMHESYLQEAVRKMALSFGWLFYHTHDARRSPEGWPDCALTRDGVLILAELKAESGKLTPAQQEWRLRLQLVEARTGGTVQYHLWKPSDLMYGRIEAALK